MKNVNVNVNDDVGGDYADGSEASTGDPKKHST